MWGTSKTLFSPTSVTLGASVTEVGIRFSTGTEDDLLYMRSLPTFNENLRASDSEVSPSEGDSFF